jgi:hypothetical protein
MSTSAGAPANAGSAPTAGGAHPIKRAEIDYGFGRAALWGAFDETTVERCFYRHANQCFGIRKSIMRFMLISIEDSEIPEPWNLIEGAAIVLKHTGDTIVWNAAGDKIKSEWQ